MRDAKFHPKRSTAYALAQQGNRTDTPARVSLSRRPPTAAPCAGDRRRPSHRILGSGCPILVQPARIGSFRPKALHGHFENFHTRDVRLIQHAPQRIRARTERGPNNTQQSKPMTARSSLSRASCTTDRIFTAVSFSSVPRCVPLCKLFRFNARRDTLHSVFRVPVRCRKSPWVPTRLRAVTSLAHRGGESAKCRRICRIRIYYAVYIYIYAYIYIYIVYT